MRSTRLPAALRQALAQLQVGADLGAVAAEVIKARAEGDVLRAELPTGDARQPQLDQLVAALEARTFDDGAISLEAVLVDLEHGEHAPS